jgi:hypothetical protein
MKEYHSNIARNQQEGRSTCRQKWYQEKEIILNQTMTCYVQVCEEPWIPF